VQFRDATPADRERILALRERCFGQVDPEKADPRFWDWEFARARCFVGEQDGQLATHLALVELPHMLDGLIVPGALAVDAMTAPEARGKGAFTNVVRHAVAQANHTVATAYQIRKSVLGAMLRAGWTSVERIPVLLRPALTLRRERNARQLDRADLQWMQNLGLRDGCIARTADFLKWRFFENPHWHYRITGIAEDAYMVTRRTTLKGFDTLAIVDLAWRDKRAARQLLHNAVAYARAEHCTLAAAFVSRRHPAFGIFLRAGFLPGPHWFRLLVHPPEYASRPWRVMWADTDHL
jgi:GNAT superfamily N-acetyltransferase